MKVGLKYPVFAPTNDDETYKTGFVISKAIKADLNAESNDVKAYGDDGVAESDKSFKSGKVSINITDLTNKVYAGLLGHQYREATAENQATVDGVISNANDIAPYGGVGYYGKVTRNNKTSWMAKWLYKVQFAEPADNMETKGETVNFQSETIEGDVFTLANGNWKDQEEFTTEDAAIKWLNAKANITTTPETPETPETP